MTNPTDIEAEARRRLSEVLSERDLVVFYSTCTRQNAHQVEAMCRLLEEYQAFRREVSDAVEYIKALYPTMPTSYDRFIIPKSDPLVEALVETYPRANGAEMMAQDLREALAKRGGRIVFDGEKAGG